jgi:hypothetical protein
MLLGFQWIRLARPRYREETIRQYGAASRLAPQRIGQAVMATADGVKLNLGAWTFMPGLY